MRRLFRMSFLAVMLCTLGFTAAWALPESSVSGRIAPEEVRIFSKDTVYKVDFQLVVDGTLIIEPGTTVKFSPNGRLLVQVGGRLIADAYANAVYTAKPDGIDPMPHQNTMGWTGYADLNYFLYSNTIVPGTPDEKTINAAKRDYVYNVVLNTATREISDFPVVNGGRELALGANEVIIPFEKAIVYRLAGLQFVTDPVNDDRNINPFRRTNSSTDISVLNSPINFVGQSTNNFTREKGHIIVLPGARAAFFRGCSFENMRKDTTVDVVDYYAANAFPNAAAMNTKMKNMLNGAGGAISTFSSRTWLISCKFKQNMARNAAGALQVLQAPEGFPTLTKAEYDAIPFYPAGKNPNLTNIDGEPSKYNNSIKRFDNLDETIYSEPLTDYERQAYDDARLAMFLGRIRNVKFEQNHVKLTNVKVYYVGGIPVLIDDDGSIDPNLAPAVYPQKYGNFAKGGAVLVAGRTTEGNQIEVGFGVNTKIKINDNNTTLDLTDYDTTEFVGNFAWNFQQNLGSLGSMGGAIYLGANTSLIVSGKFNANEALSVLMDENEVATRSGEFAKGGAIYQENTLARLQIRNNPRTSLITFPTVFENNKSGNGGAVYVNGNDDAEMSPIIGGSDRFPSTRDLGYNIKFLNNTASAEGGAVYTKRNMRINGAGGVESNALIGYTNDFRINFRDNEAGYSGGAITIALPFTNPALAPEKRNIHFARALFQNNRVGYNITEALNRTQVRGGGAVYSYNSDMNVVKAVEFNANKVKNGNGGAIAMVHPVSFSKRFFISDLDKVTYDAAGVPVSYESYNDPFIHNHETAKYPADARMLTRFLDNVIEWDNDILESQSGNGMTQITSGTITTKATINDVEFMTPENGIAVGTQGTIIKMTAGGAVWEYRNLSTPYNLKGIHFTTNLVGFIVGDRGLVLKTVDGGNSWTEVRPATSNFNLHAITFVNSNLGFAVGQNGNMIKTTDAGNTWTVLASGTVNHLNAVRFVGVNNGYAVGNRGTILITNDGGMNWNVLNANTLANFNSVYFTDNTTGYIAGEGVIYKSTNSGASWNNIYADATKGFTSIFFTGLNTGYAVGTFGEMIKTVDAGATWTSQDVTINGNKVYHKFNNVYFTTPTTAVIGGDAGLMVRTTDGGATWNEILPLDIATIDVVRYHPGANMRENGIGLGGAIYILDSVTTRDGSKDDYIKFNRVRIQDNVSYTGAAIYSDNYDLKLVFSRSLITGNEASSEIGMNQNYISGPALDKDKTGKITANYASSDLAGAIIYGEIIGPEPFDSPSWAANSIYGNKARFLIRLPDAPNTKGALAGRRPGPGGIDTLRGNYWGKTEADVTFFINNIQSTSNENMATFFVDKCDKTYLNYVFGSNVLLEQGPFEVNGTYSALNRADEVITAFNYSPIPLSNGATENVADTLSIPEKFVMSGRIYDLYDKGTDIKVADYSHRRLSPIEDFAVGIPARIRSHADAMHPNKMTYLTRWIRDPFVTEMTNEDGTLKYPMLASLQGEWRPDKNNQFYHPIGYPLFLEAKVNYDGDVEQSNHDARLLNESVFFVINETTGDFIRTNMKQVAEDGINWETFRTRVELVPDLTKRNAQTTIRRSAEKLLNLGIGDVLLYALKSNPTNEDAATLEGRKYYGNKRQMGGKYMPGAVTSPNVNNLYLNQDWWAPTNQDNATYFAGEKYQALPVDTGDIVRVISRTVLWKDGVVKAFDEGISFKVTRSIGAPEFTGDIVNLQDSAINGAWTNKVRVTEDRKYPANAGDYTGLGFAAGRDSILAVTAIDYNGMYDPRALDASTADYFAKLKYSMSTTNGSGLSQWLRYTILPAGQIGNENEKDGAHGYMVLRGTPMNSYVVPGGEDVYVTAENFPPHMVTINQLGDLYAQDTLDKFIYIFPPYMNAPVYDLGENSLRARYLQQDTIDYASNYKTTYNFKLFVVDSTPRFIDNTTNPVVFYKDLNYNPVKNVAPLYQDSNSVRVMYVPSIYRNGFCTVDGENRIIASLTDKLRMQVDFNTDDEAEDFWARQNAWDFRYGKSSYGFFNTAMRENPSDTAIIDTYVQTRPIWMSNDYIYSYNSDNSKDEFANDFTANGQLNIRVAGDVARDILGVRGNVNSAMNLDTMFTVYANDGHSGMTMMPVEVYVNVAPEILGSDRLPDAKESEEYNPGLNDTTKQIRIYDPNFDQTHRYELIYANDPRTSIPKDPCFSEAGEWDLTGIKTTPEWLKINPVSGMLYGTPEVTDKIDEADAQVTVLVWDIIEQAIAKQDITTLKSNGTDFYAVGQKGTIIKVNPANNTWKFVTVAGTEAFNLNDITFVNSDKNIGYIVGNNGIILKTIDAGATWNIINTTYRDYNFRAVDFATANDGVIVGERGNIYITNDGGTTWTKPTDKTYNNKIHLNKVKMLDVNTFVVVGDQGKAFRTNNGGATINSVTSGSTANIKDMYFINSTTGLAVTETSVLKTTDEGASWTANTTVGIPGINGIGYYDIDNNDGFGTTKQNIVYIAANGGRFAFSADAGDTWNVSGNGASDVITSWEKNMKDNITGIKLNDVLMIDTTSGIFVGTNGAVIKFNTRNANSSVQDVKDTLFANAVILTTKGNDMLSAVKTFNMKVDTVLHTPIITDEILPTCIDLGTLNFTDTLYVYDLDFRRPGYGEIVTLTVESPNDPKWKVINGVKTVADAFKIDPLTNDTIWLNKILFELKYEGSLDNVTPDGEGKFSVEIKATDKSGNSYIYKVTYRYSEKPDFISHITVANSKGSFDVIDWGTALKTDDKPVSTGEGEVVDGFPLGNLDQIYCEYEIPPVPPTDVFDVRWVIPTRKGISRNIYPRAIQGVECRKLYRAVFQSGGEAGTNGSSSHFPIYISWRKSEIPEKNDPNNPAGSTWYIQDANSEGNIFLIDMRTGFGKYTAAVQVNTSDPDIITIQLNQNVVSGFNILYDCTSTLAVEDNSDFVSGIQKVTPNPVESSSNVQFGLANYGQVKIELYDALGNLVNTIANDVYPAGIHNVVFDAIDMSGKALSSGTYTVRMTAGTVNSTYQVKIVK